MRGRRRGGLLWCESDWEHVVDVRVGNAFMLLCGIRCRVMW